jgi:exodeoxyribonuclease VII small subunit
MAPRKTAEAPATPADSATDGAPSFEQALERLETIVDQLEGGELSLEESLARYEEGVRLSQRLTQTLDEAEKRIESLVEEPDQPPTTRSLELELKPAERSGGEDELPF